MVSLKQYWLQINIKTDSFPQMEQLERDICVRNNTWDASCSHIHKMIFQMQNYQENLFLASKESQLFC